MTRRVHLTQGAKRDIVRGAITPVVVVVRHHDRPADIPMFAAADLEPHGPLVDADDGVLVVA